MDEGHVNQDEALPELRRAPGASLQRQLYGSARRWAGAALDAYLQSGDHNDFAVHHMAIAVEHLSKAYLCSISDTLLLPEKPRLQDLLILAGKEDLMTLTRAQAHTVSGGEAIVRVGELLGRKQSAASLARLREGRNSIAHLAESMTCQ